MYNILYSKYFKIGIQNKSLSDPLLSRHTCPLIVGEAVEGENTASQGPFNFLALNSVSNGWMDTGQWTLDNTVHFKIERIQNKSLSDPLLSTHTLSIDSDGGIEG